MTRNPAKNPRTKRRRMAVGLLPAWRGVTCLVYVVPQSSMVSALATHSSDHFAASSRN
jgi:hypothetical protein